jgi:hypothetical protein
VDWRSTSGRLRLPDQPERAGPDERAHRRITLKQRYGRLVVGQAHPEAPVPNDGAAGAPSRALGLTPSMAGRRRADTHCGGASRACAVRSRHKRNP